MPGAGCGTPPGKAAGGVRLPGVPGVTDVPGCPGIVWTVDPGTVGAGTAAPAAASGLLMPPEEFGLFIPAPEFGLFIPPVPAGATPGDRPPMAGLDGAAAAAPAAPRARTVVAASANAQVVAKIYFFFICVPLFDSLFWMVPGDTLNERYCGHSFCHTSSLRSHFHRRSPGSGSTSDSDERH